MCGCSTRSPPDLISKITDAVHPEVASWQARPLNAVYPVIFLDALVCKARDGGSAGNKGRAPGRRRRHRGPQGGAGDLGGDHRGREVLLRVTNKLKARGVQDVLIAVCDGLTGLPEAINAVWPATRVQTCIVHLIRASLRWGNYKERQRVAALLRPIYGVPTEAATRAELDVLADFDCGRESPDRPTCHDRSQAVTPPTLKSWRGCREQGW
jgi:putative transposase